MKIPVFFERLYRYCSFGTRLLQANFLSGTVPYKINLIVTYHCNSRCKHCAIWRKEHVPELSVLDYQKMLSQVSAHWIDVSGGEIVLRKDIRDIFQICLNTQKRLALLHFPTNGSFPEKVWELSHDIVRIFPGKLVVSVSLDGPRGLHNQLRGTDSWEKAVETFKRLREITKKNFGVFFGYTISEENASVLEETFRDLRRYIPKISYRDIHINIDHISPHYYANSFRKIDREKVLAGVYHYARKRTYGFGVFEYLERAYHRSIAGYLNLGKTPRQCVALRDSVFIDPYGNVFPCSIYAENLGNIKEYDFSISKILSLESAGHLRKEIQGGKCPQCWTPCEAYPMILGSFFKKHNHFLVQRKSKNNAC